MKIWIGHGSEHSASLVLIGHFRDETQASKAEQRLTRLREAAENELPEVGWDVDKRFTDGLRELLEELKVWDLSRSDLEDFAFEHTARRTGSVLEISTDETEIQGFLKVLIGAGARIEIYSSHEWTADGKPRPDEGDTSSETSSGGADSDAASGQNQPSAADAATPEADAGKEQTPEATQPSADT